MQFLSSPWIPPTILSAFILLGIFIGFLNGWKTNLYLFTFNFLAILFSLISFPFIYKNLLDITPNNINIDGLNISEWIEVNHKNLMSIYGLVYLIVNSLITTVFAFILYWVIPPLRKKLNGKMKINKKKGISNTRVRFIGSGLGVISFIPLGTISASVSSVSSEDSNKFTEINSTIVRGLTLGKYDDAEESLQEIRSLILIRDDDEFQDIFSTILGVNDINDLPKTFNPELKKHIENILNSKMGVSTISNLNYIENLFIRNQLKEINFKKPPENSLEDQYIPKIKVANRDSIIDAIVTGIVPYTKDRTATKEDVKKYISTLLKWK